MVSNFQSLFSNIRKNSCFCCFRRNPQRFKCCHCCLFIIVDCTFLGYFSMSVALHPVFSSPRRLPSALSSTLTAFPCFLVLGLLFLVLLLLYRECYEFRESILYYQVFFFLFPHTFSPHFLHALLQLAFIKVSLGAGSSSLKVARSPAVV